MITDTAVLVGELIVLFFVVTLGIHLLQRRVGPSRVQKWMGGNAPMAALKGIAVGFVTPFCTFSAIPMLVGLRQAEVRTAGYVAFIVAAPVLDPVLFGALVLIVGLPAALIYLGIAFVAAFGLAMVADAIGIDRHLKALQVGQPVLAGLPPGRSSQWPAVLHTQRESDVQCAASTPCSAESTEPWRGWTAELRDGAAAAVLLLRSVAVVLAIGIVVGIAIEQLVSPEMAAQITGSSNRASIPIAAILGTPLYFSTALFVPIADSLTSAGVGIGAVVALTISGAGASLPEFLLLTKFATTRILSVFFTYVLGVAVAGGFLVEALL